MSSTAKRICFNTADSQETTIEELCDDVLVEIFSYLSAEDLKSASLVCKHWNEVVGSSAKTMKKFKLKLKEIELIGRQFRSTRNYQNIELEMLATNPPSDQKSLENLGNFHELSQVKYFKIFAHNPAADYGNRFAYVSDYPWYKLSIDAMKLTSALKQMKQLQELFIECPAGFRGSFNSTIDLPKLTKLAVKSPDLSILQWISASNVTEIDVITSVVTSGVQHLASFLKLCKQITVLKLNSSLVHDLFEHGKWKDFNLKLSDLHIEGNANRDATSLREFLISQALSLTFLRMKNVLRYLSESREESFIEAMGQLKNLKILSLDYYFRPEETFLRQMTKLEQLTLVTVNDINSIARFNRKLTYLKINYLDSPLDAALKFSELKHLCIWLDHSNCLKVIKGSPRVETVELRLLLGYSCNEIIKAAMLQPTLRHLKLEFWNGSSNRGTDWYIIENLRKAFDLITSDYRNLKSLSLSIKAGPRSRLKSVEFLFPENRLEWKADEQKMRLDETFGNK